MKKVPSGNPQKAEAFRFYVVGVGFGQRTSAGRTSASERRIDENTEASPLPEPRGPSAVRGVMMSALVQNVSLTRRIAEAERQCAMSGVGVACVCAEVRVREAGIAPPSSSHRWISRRGSLCRSRCLRRSSDTPSASAPIGKSPTVQFIRRFQCLYRSAHASTNRSCRARATFSLGDASASTVAREKNELATRK